MTPPVSPSAPQDDPTNFAGFQALVAELRAQNAALVARVAELGRRLGLHSGNSSKPPSSDGPNKPRRTGSLRETIGQADRRSDPP